MSEANVETIRRILQAAQAGDWEGALAHMHEDVELDMRRFPDGAVYHGLAEYWDFYRRWFGTWDDLRVTPERFIDTGDRVVVLAEIAGKGKGSGISVMIKTADVWTVRDGKAVHQVGFVDRDEALEEFGLKE